MQYRDREGRTVMRGLASSRAALQAKLKGSPSITGAKVYTTSRSEPPLQHPLGHRHPSLPGRPKGEGARAAGIRLGADRAWMYSISMMPSCSDTLWLATCARPPPHPTPPHVSRTDPCTCHSTRVKREHWGAGQAGRGIPKNQHEALTMTAVKDGQSAWEGARGEGGEGVGDGEASQTRSARSSKSSSFSRL